MNDKWLELKNRFEAFELRERCLMVGAAAAVIYLLWDFILLQPIAKETKILLARERVAEQAIQTGEAEITVLTAVAKKDPNNELRRNLLELQDKLKQLDARLDTLATGLVAADKLPQVMHDVLRQTGKLKIASMTTLPPQEVVLSKDSEPTAAAATASAAAPTTETAAEPAMQSVKIYKHGVALNLVGDFSSAVQYLQTLEQGAWRFYWESLDYQVSQYPQAKIQLKVFTLSSQRGVLDGA